MPSNTPLLSLVVVVHNMPREAPRTLFTLTPGYQNVSPDRYEVLVVDNGSTPPLGRDTVEAISPHFQYVYLEPGTPSPARALNQGASRVRGRVMGFMIDGARMISPGVLQYAIRAARAYRDPVIGTLGFHLGPRPQQESAKDGYNQEGEDRLLESVDWRRDGYQLFQIASLAGSSKHGWFAPLGESNCMFVTRSTFEILGGFDEAFDYPGGGLLNLDFYRRACERPETELVILLGEGSFHQYHGGATTGQTESAWEELAAQYRRIRGRDYQTPRVRCDFLGHAPLSVLPSVRDSLDRLDRFRQSTPTGEGVYEEHTIPPNPLPADGHAQRSVVILGMHRSGTSVLAGSLQEVGLVLGDVVTQAPHNKKGNRENRAIMFMQEDLLRCNGGSWDNPPEAVHWEQLHLAVRDLFIAGFEEARIWGFKDPRTLITLDGWLDVLPNAALVGIFRHPTRVALSLQQRNGFPMEKGFRLWQVYNQRLLHLHRAREFPLMEFHENADEFRSKLRRVIALLELGDGERPLTFFESTLRRKVEVDIVPPSEVHQLYNDLKARAI